jgi:hypothetical protein
MAATANGGAISPESTSVRTIAYSENVGAGAVYGTFVSQERLPPSPSLGQVDLFWVEVK